MILRTFFVSKAANSHHRCQKFFPLRQNSRSLSTIINSNNASGKFRVAIVGAGASGMSVALHLAPLVEKGLIAKPIDMYVNS